MVDRPIVGESPGIAAHMSAGARSRFFLTISLYIIKANLSILGIYMTIQMTI